jgi:hypothetical protein
MFSLGSERINGGTPPCVCALRDSRRACPEDAVLQGAGGMIVITNGHPPNPLLLRTAFAQGGICYA